jgi:hypothetical protein
MKRSAKRAIHPGGPTDCGNEEEVRLLVCTELGIGKTIKILGKTDGVWKNKLFEFKFDKRFFRKGGWKASAYGAVAQALYYCRQIAESLVEGINEVPHSIIVCDEKGGFFIQTGRLEWLLQFDPSENLDFSGFPELVKFKKHYRFLKDRDFRWDTPPSSQNRSMVELLMSISSLDKVDYFNFENAG